MSVNRANMGPNISIIWSFICGAHIIKIKTLSKVTSSISFHKQHSSLLKITEHNTQNTPSRVLKGTTYFKPVQLLFLEGSDFGGKKKKRQGAVHFHLSCKVLSLDWFSHFKKDHYVYKVAGN